MYQIIIERQGNISIHNLTNAKALPYLRKYSRFLRFVRNDIPTKITIKYYNYVRKQKG
jgi:hypothetical protein